MIAGTHRIISNIVIDCLKDEGLTLLDRKKFLWGSVKPDFTVPPFRKKHYMDETLNDVVQWMLNVIYDFTLNVRDLSEKIGEINHFLTDFFCLPHSERWDFIRSGKTIDHIVYEKKLHHYAVYYFRMITPVHMEFSPFHTQASVCEWIIQNYLSYKEKTDYLHDLKQASGICLAATRWMILQRYAIGKPIIIY